MAATFDLTDPDIQRCPFDHYGPLRDGEPVQRVDRGVSEGNPTFVVSRYEDVSAVLRDPATFSSRLLPLPVMLFLDPPDHDRIRRTVARAFTPKAVSVLEPSVRARAAHLAARFVETGGGDFVAEFASRLPVDVIGEVLGVPTDEREQLREWSDATIRALSVQAGAAGPDAEWAVNGALALHAYLDEVVVAEARRQEAGQTSNTITAALVGFERSGEIDHAELVGFLQFMFVAGHETTMALLSHGIERIALDPALLDRLQADQQLVPGFVDELLRTWSPLQRVVRVATTDTTIAGVSIPTGSTIFVLLGSANRDPRRFPAADDIDIDAPGTGHVAFGLGIHHCLGAPLARIEGRAAFDALLERIGRVALDPANPPLRFAGGTTSELQSTTLHLLVEARAHG